MRASRNAPFQYEVEGSRDNFKVHFWTDEGVADVQKWKERSPI